MDPSRSIQVEPSEIVKVSLSCPPPRSWRAGRADVPGLESSGSSCWRCSVLPVRPHLQTGAPWAVPMVLAVVMKIGMLLRRAPKAQHIDRPRLLAAVRSAGSCSSGPQAVPKDRLLTFLVAPSGVGKLRPAPTAPTRNIEYQLGESKAAITDGGLGGKGLFKGDRDQLVPTAQPVDRLHLSPPFAEQFGLRRFGGSCWPCFVLMIWRSGERPSCRAICGTLICVGCSVHAHVPGLREHSA